MSVLLWLRDTTDVFEGDGSGWIEPAPFGGGSVAFGLGNYPSYVEFGNSADWALGTDDFTIEFFLYLQDNSGNYPRVFSIGSYGVEGEPSIAVSIEGGVLYFWANGNVICNGTIPTPFVQWNYFMIRRVSGETYVNNNASLIASSSTVYDVTNDTLPLTIGQESAKNLPAQCNGYISNFHWVKGTALQSEVIEPIVVPSAPITPVANTKLLLKDFTGETIVDSSGLNKTVVDSLSYLNHPAGPFAP